MNFLTGNLWWNGQARREKISERMKILQDLVPGCNKVWYWNFKFHFLVIPRRNIRVLPPAFKYKKKFLRPARKNCEIKNIGKLAKRKKII